MSTTSIPDNRQVVNTPCPSTSVEEKTFGPVTVTLYERWHGNGYDVIARNGRELERTYATYYPAALARYTTMVHRYQAQWQAALTDTMLGLDECSCNGANRDGCPACRATARRVYGEVLS